MVLRKFSWRLAAAVAGGALLGGCTSAAVQTPTLSYLDIEDRPVGYPGHLSAGSSQSSQSSGNSGSYGLLFSPRENTDRFGVANAYYLHPLPHNLKDYIPIAANWRPSTKDITRPDPSIWRDPEFRNFVQNDLLRRSDQICNAYQARLINGFVVGQSMADGAGALLKILAAPIEAASATFSVGLNNASLQFSNDFLKWQSFQAAHSRIMYSRRNLRNLIRNAQLLKSEQYSFSQAIYDAERYHSYCNITMAYVGGEEWTGKDLNERIVPELDAKNEKQPPSKEGSGTATQVDLKANSPG